MDIANLEVHWYWLAAGLLLIALEAFIPGAVLLWFGVAAVLTGLLTMALDLSSNVQLIFFSVVAVASTVAYKRWRKQHPVAPALSEGGTSLNQPGHDLIGRSLVLVTALSNGSGRVKVADSSWRCTGPDLPAGTRVTVTGLEGSTLVVAPQDPDAPD